MPGMTLSDPVLDTKGNILLPGGAVLTSALLASLQRHQIDTIAIAAAAVSQVDADAERDRQIARVERLFRTPGTVTSAAGAVPALESTELLHRYILKFRSGASS
jgi:hypothetical protein